MMRKLLVLALSLCLLSTVVVAADDDDDKTKATKRVESAATMPAVENAVPVTLRFILNKIR